MNGPSELGLAAIAAPVLFTLFAWWFSTGVILYLDGLPRWTFRWTMIASTILLALALLGLHATADDTRVTGAFLAFICALTIWAWQEVAFLLGYVTGPRRTACPPGADGWRRTIYAFQAVAWHELALVVLAVAVVATTWNAPNQTGLWTFAVLWTMRLSAKLNVFFGVRNLSENFLPPHLTYLQTYFRRRRWNALWPVSVTVATGVAIVLWGQVLDDGTTAFRMTSITFAAALLTLAILEHGFMMLPLPSERLWDWGLRSRTATSRRSGGRGPTSAGG